MAVDLSKVENLYSESIKEFGIDAKSVGWGTKVKQDLRFDKLLSVIGESKSFSINELGCGYGEMVKFCEHNNFNLNRYEGYDISKKMIEAASNYLINYQNIHLYNLSEIKNKLNYTISSGIFNVKFDESIKNWEEYIKETLMKMFEKSDKGIAFNLLSKYVDYKSSNELFYADPMDYFEFCKKNMSKKVNLLHDYELYEWTITVNI